MTRLALGLVLLSAACTGGKGSSPSPATPLQGQVITAQSSGAGLLVLTPTVRDDGLLLNVSGVPDGATLECHLDGGPLSPCSDGSLYGRPPVGDHRVTAVAVRGGAVVALGQSKTFTVLPGGGAVTKGDARQALTVVLDDAAFSNGMTAPLTKDFTVHFKLAGKAPCDQPTLRCRYDSRAGQFWTACDKGDKSFTVGKDLMAQGLQYLTVRATCSDQTGDTLTVFWYGVPDGYKPLTLKDLSVGNGQHVVNLVKSDDCPASQQTFECADADGSPFAACPTGNVLDRPASGQQIRVSCNGRTGPALTF